MRGISKGQEQKTSKLIRDTRSVGQKLNAFFEKPINVAILIILFSMIAFILPLVADLVIVLKLYFLLFQCLAKRFHLECRTKRRR